MGTTSGRLAAAHLMHLSYACLHAEVALELRHPLQTGRHLHGQSRRATLSTATGHSTWAATLGVEPWPSYGQVWSHCSAEPR